jgi:hypothetical protein
MIAVEMKVEVDSTGPGCSTYAKQTNDSDGRGASA